MPRHYLTTTAKNAAQRGYEPLTMAYTLPREEAMLKSALADLSGADICLVEVRPGRIEIHRHRKQIKSFHEAVKERIRDTGATARLYHEAAA